MIIEGENIHQILTCAFNDGTSFSDNTQYPGTDMIEVSSDVASISWLNV